MDRGLKFRGDCTIFEAKTNALISCADTAQLICGFVFALAKIRFSDDAAHYESRVVQLAIFLTEKLKKSYLFIYIALIQFDEF